MLWFLLLFCGLTLAQDGGHAAETQSCSPDMCNLLKEFGAMSEKIKSMETRLRNSETKVFFSAGLPDDGPVGPFHTDTTLIYRQVITNIGNAYNAATGVFTAPVAGVYYFTFFFHSGGEHRTYLQLYKNSELVAETQDHASEADTADNGGNAVYLQLQPGDRVYVRLLANCHIWGGGRITTFSGSLVTHM